ncbi:hypothetical protein [Phaffia rhodozyma]|uniref:F-box domain-containing protein n=1 Tax=Phaffia rhodozyma TaxID=264483 RepID=A0A0F7SFE0_PHARH|nr:hypothetical protein [Phaffia rhodozyma]
MSDKPYLPFDIWQHVLPHLADSPSTLVSLSLVCTFLAELTTRSLYTHVHLAKSSIAYQSFFRTFTSPLYDQPKERESPLKFTKTLTLGAYGEESISKSASTSMLTSLTTTTRSSAKIEELNLPPLPRSLFPQLETLEIGCTHSDQIASILPILITLNPVHVRLCASAPEPPFSSGGEQVMMKPQSIKFSFIPHFTWVMYNRLESVFISKCDVHPPSSSDYPPYYEFPFPSTCTTLRSVEWDFRGAIGNPPLFRGFFRNQIGLWDWKTPLRVSVWVDEESEGEGMLKSSLASVLGDLVYEGGEECEKEWVDSKVRIGLFINGAKQSCSSLAILHVGSKLDTWKDEESKEIAIR